MDVSRRNLIRFSAALTPWLYFASKAQGSGDFWNKQAPSTWTSDQVVLLSTRSPWAKETRIDFKAKGKDAEGDHSSETGPTPFGVNRGDPGKNAGKPLSVVVTWQSALPLYDALHDKLPASLLGHYVIGVKDLPIVVDAGPERESPEQLLDWLKNSATLKAKSRDAVQCGVVTTAREGSLLLFGFLRELMPLAANDKEVIFTLDTNQLALKTRFEPREMIYKGELAL